MSVNGGTVVPGGKPDSGNRITRGWPWSDLHVTWFEGAMQMGSALSVDGSGPTTTIWLPQAMTGVGEAAGTGLFVTVGTGAGAGGTVVVDFPMKYPTANARTPTTTRGKALRDPSLDVMRAS